MRPAERADLDSVAEVDRAVFAGAAYPGFFFRQALDLWGALFWVAEAGPGRVEGYVLAAPAARVGEACVLSAGVRPALRGRGIATRLLEALLERLGAEGIARVWLTVHPENEPALRLYARLGFRVAGEEPDYFGPAEPRLRLEMRIPAPPAG